MIDVIKLVLLAAPLLCVAAAFALHRTQCVEAHNRLMRKSGSQITP
jgi:hypothetical protein